MINNLSKEPLIPFIGTVALVEDQVEQICGLGWGWRYKVAIFDYYSSSVSEIKDSDLDYAIALCPNDAGSGAANFAKSLKIRQGDVVYGNIVGGKKGIKVILGIFGRTNDTQYGAGRFDAKSGYSDEVTKPDPSVSTAKEDNEPTGQEGPVQLPQDKARQDKRAAAGGGAIGQKVIFANTCENTTLTGVEAELENLIKWLQERQGKIGEFQEKIDETAEIIKSYMNWLIGEITKSITNFLVGDPNNPEVPGIIPMALNALYTTVYSATLPTAGPAAAHIAGSQAIEVFAVPISALEAAIICVTNALLEGLITLIKELLLSMVDNIENFVTCVLDKFIGSLLTSVVDRIANGLSDALGALSGLLGGVIDIATVAQDAISLFNSLDSLLDCNQVNTKCDGTKEWIIGVGPKDVMDIDQSFDNIFNFVNDTTALINDGINAGREVGDGATGAFNSIDEAIKGTVDIFNSSAIAQGDITSCLPIYPTSCGSAQIKIFGGGGTGGSAVPIFGPTVARALNDTSIGQNINRTANIIGATLTNAGSGYRFPPFVEITDECGIGYGARARSTINNKGEIESIYIVSSGENYPIGSEVDNIGEDNVGEDNIGEIRKPIGVIDTVVVATGIGYGVNDIATDNFGNEYSLVIDNGRIISASPINTVDRPQTEISDIVTIKVNSETGLGAVLKPVLGVIPPPAQENFIRVIDCIS